MVNIYAIYVMQYHAFQKPPIIIFSCHDFQARYLNNIEISAQQRLLKYFTKLQPG